MTLFTLYLSYTSYDFIFFGDWGYFAYHQTGNHKVLDDII